MDNPRADVTLQFFLNQHFAPITNLDCAQNHFMIPEDVGKVSGAEWRAFFKNNETLLSKEMPDLDVAGSTWSRQDATAFQRYFGIEGEDVSITSK